MIGRYTKLGVYRELLGRRGGLAELHRGGPGPQRRLDDRRRRLGRPGLLPHTGGRGRGDPLKGPRRWPK